VWQLGTCQFNEWCLIAQMIGLVRRRNIGDYFPAIRRFDVQGIEAGLKEVEVQLRQSITTLIEKKKLEMGTWSTEEIRSGANDRGIMSKLLSVEGEDRFSEEQLISVVFVRTLTFLPWTPSAFH